MPGHARRLINPAPINTPSIWASTSTSTNLDTLSGPLVVSAGRLAPCPSGRAVATASPRRARAAAGGGGGAAGRPAGRQ
eukprot:scaffold499764_cov24-Prasinocladus_malaysianus.AAC.1